MFPFSRGGCNPDLTTPPTQKIKYIKNYFTSGSTSPKRITHIFIAAGVHSGVITEDLDVIDGGRIHTNALQGDARHSPAVIGGLANNEDAITPLGMIFAVHSRSLQVFSIKTFFCNEGEILCK